jgi:predicted neutral ceramidase superfamily lipid hydrolase
MPFLLSIWITLVTLTVLTAYLGTTSWFIVSYVMLIVLANVVIKSYLIIDFFMGLSKSAFIWRFLMIFYVIFVCGGIILAYFL